MKIYIYSRRYFLKAVSLGAVTLAAGRLVNLRAAPKMQPQERVFPRPIKGVVFTDSNKNGVMDPQDAPRAGIAVSDGLDVVLTGQDGRYTLPNTNGDAPFVFVIQPSDCAKNATSFYRLPGPAGKTEDINFALTAAGPAASLTKTRFVQISDIHTTSQSGRFAQIKACEEIFNLTPPADFIIATGDIVDHGSNQMEFSHALAAAKKSPLPYFHAIGNHDLAKGDNPLGNFRKFVEPDYYSFDFGGVHFIALNSITPSQRQDAWLKNDLAAIGANRPVVIFQHYVPTVEELKKFDSLNIQGVFSGHWHSERVVRSSKTISVNTPSFYIGGIDFSPAGFKVVEIGSDGAMKTQWRYGGVSRRATIVTPAQDSAVYNCSSPIIVNIYDTSVDAEQVNWSLYQNEQLKASGKLCQENPFNWTAVLPQRCESGPAELRIEAANKRDWKTQSRFNFVERTAVTPKPVKPWPMFMGRPNHTGSSDIDLALPLQLAWSSGTGGELDLSSPVFADGRIYVAVKSRRTGGENGIVALDPSSGKIIWRFRTEQAINHTPAYEDGVICTVEVGGRVYGIAAASGEKIWSHDLDGNLGRWNYGAPAAYQGKFYVGTMNRFARIDAKSGAVDWEKRIGQGKDTDWISSYSSPAVSDKYLVMGGFWTEGDNLIVMDKDSGNKIWGHSAEKGTQTSPTIAGKLVLFAGKISLLYCCKLADGTIVWSKQLGEGWSATTAAVKGDIVVAGSGDGLLKALRLSDGSEIWSYGSGQAILKTSPYRSDNRGVLSSPTITAGKVFFGGSDGKLCCLDLQSGKMLWSYDFGVPALSTPMISENALFVAAYDGRVYAFSS